MSEKSDKKVDGVVVVKKYANRRLYDTSKSAYVTLEDLCQLVKDDVEFVVKDAKSEEDLTRTILTQIIFEQELKGYSILPAPFLKQVIKFYGTSVGCVLPSYLAKVMENFSDNEDKMKSSMGVGGGNSPFKQFEEMGKKNMEFFGQTMNIFNPFGVKPSSDEKKD